MTRKSSRIQLSNLRILTGNCLEAERAANSNFGDKYVQCLNMPILKTNAIGNCANSKVHFGFVNTMNSSKPCCDVRGFHIQHFLNIRLQFMLILLLHAGAMLIFFIAVCCFRFKKQIISLSGKYHKPSFGWLFI